MRIIVKSEFLYGDEIVINLPRERENSLAAGII